MFHLLRSYIGDDKKDEKFGTEINKVSFRVLYSTNDCPHISKIANARVTRIATCRIISFPYATLLFKALTTERILNQCRLVQADDRHKIR